jgi:DNA-binding MarR family transcriptional regulator
MSPTVTPAAYRALAEFRYRIRCFLIASEEAARAVGLEPQQYLLLLAIRGLPEAQKPTIQTLADRLRVRHHSAVELIDRLEKHGFVRRVRGIKDRRQVLVRLTARGERVLARLAQQRLRELCATGPALVRALHTVISRTKRSSRLRRE